ncbi:hypothetical protein ACFL0H_10810 [Thermodesulfobacteriota bacterium]
MEDHRREMDPDQEEIPVVREHPFSPRDLTVMVIRSVGKIRSFKVSRRLLFLALIFFLAYIIISLYHINSFWDLRYKYRIQLKKLELLEDDLAKNRKRLLQTRQHVAILEDYVQSVQEIGAQESVQVARKKERVPEEIKKAKAEVIDKKEDVREDEQEEGKRLKVVGIAEIVIRKENSGMRVNFRLVNMQPGETAMEGYIHIIAMDKKNDFPPEWNYANDKLKNGLPLNFRRGQPFLIQRFKPYHRTFNLSSNFELPSAIKVLVYDRSGALVLEKEFEVSNVS